MRLGVHEDKDTLWIVRYDHPPSTMNYFHGRIFRFVNHKRWAMCAQVIDQ